MKDLINFENTVDSVSDVKIFRGKYDGIQRYDRYRYPYSEKLVKAQQGATWFPKEISYSKDKVSIPLLPKEYVKVYTENLLFQTLADSLANRFLDNILSGVVTSPEWEATLKWQAHFELIHSESYSHNIREVFPDAEEIFSTGFKNEKIQNRLNLEREAYKKLQEEINEEDFDFFSDKNTEDKVKNSILDAIVQQYALESMRFMVSFLYTLKINSIFNQSLQGSANSIKLILNDEIIHTVIFSTLIGTLMIEESEGFTELFTKDREEKIIEVFDDVLESEMEWFRHLSSIQEIQGFTESTMRVFLENIKFSSLKAIGIKRANIVKRDSEITLFFNKEKKINNAKTLAQETEVLSYNIGVLRDDGFEEEDINIDLESTFEFGEIK